MIGYVIVNEQELKIKDYKKYKGVYCGLCQTLKHQYGPFGQLCLNNDMTFMALLHMSLYEDETCSRERDYRCFLHPVKKIHIYENEHLEYAADMTLLLSYYLAQDHWRDDRRPEAFIQIHILRKKVRKICQTYPRQFRAVKIMYIAWRPPNEPVKAIWINWRGFREPCWERYSTVRMISGPICLKMLDFISGNIFILWMLMKIWSRISKREVLIL